MRRILLAAMMFGAASGAEAADMPDFPILRGGFTDGLTTARVNWQGWYVGGQADYGAVRSGVPGGLNGDMQATYIPPPALNNPYNWPALKQANSRNNGYGAFAGYNSQWDDVVVGFEANYIHDGFSSQTNATGYRYLPDNITVESLTYSTATVKLSDFGSARVRAGYVIGCFLPYAFVGAGMGSQTVDRTISAFPDPLRPGWTTDSKSKLVYGYSAGAGLDVMLIGGLFARAEYEYRRVTSNIESNIHSARLGVGYKF